MIIGYPCVSIQDQTPEFQVDTLEKAGCEKVLWGIDGRSDISTMLSRYWGSAIPIIKRE